MNPANSMKGMTHHVRIAPPVNTTSVIFIAASIPIMEINDMPMAVLNASRTPICRVRITVSSMMEVISPLKIASDMIAHTGHGVPVNWKYAIVPISPMAQPIKHHMVL